MIRLFVGLGNPGPEYENTRHNAGFWWIDALARTLNVPLVMDRSYHGQTARTASNGQTVWLLKPQTFMNLSGKSVATLRPVRPSSSWAAATPVTTVCVTFMPNWAPTSIGACGWELATRATRLT